MLHHSLALTAIAPHLLARAPHIHRSGHLDVRIATSEEEVAAAQALRYRIFYEEMGARPTLAMQASAATSTITTRSATICW
jgi:putative hemolysin